MTASVPIDIRGIDKSAARRTPPALSLYVHFPWCARKCPYCDFNSHAQPETDSATMRSRYLQALHQDLESALPTVWGRSVRSVFIGGGTPHPMNREGSDPPLFPIPPLPPPAPPRPITLPGHPPPHGAPRLPALPPP